MDFDGLCGIIAPFASSDLQLRCQHELGHHGPCSWKKFERHFMIMGGTFCSPDPERGFIDSVLSHQEK